MNFVIASKLWRNRLPSFLMPVVSSMACESRQQLYAAFANCTLAIMFNSDFMTQIRDCEWLTYLSYPRRNLDRPVIVFLLFYAVIQVFVNNRFVNFFIFFSRIFLCGMSLFGDGCKPFCDYCILFVDVCVLL